MNLCEINSDKKEPKKDSKKGTEKDKSTSINKTGKIYYLNIIMILLIILNLTNIFLN